MNFKNKSRLILPGLLLIFIALCYYFPHLVYFPNRDDFANYFIKLIYPLLLSGLLLVIAAWLLLTLFPHYILKYISSIIMVLALFLWLQGDMFSISYGVLDGSIINFERYKQRGLNELIVLSLALIASIFFQKTVNKHLPFILIIITLIQTSLVSYHMVTEPLDKNIVNKIDPEFFNYSSNKNIIFIILDTFGADYFNEIRTINPTMVDDFSGFVNYTDAISNYPATKGSLPSIMSGKMIPDNMSYRDFNNNIVAVMGLPKQLENKGFLVSVISVYKWFKFFYKKRYISDPPLDSRKINKYNSYKLLDFSLFRALPHFLKPKIYNRGSWMLSGTLATQQELPNTPSEKGVYLLNLMKDYAVVKDKINRFKLIHVLLPHPEFVYDSNCNKHQDKKPVRSLMLMQSMCAIKKLKEYLNKLKELSIYDSSLIVVVSDHGSRISTDKSIHGFPSYFEMDSSGVLFMIKGIDQKDKFQDLDSPVSLIKLYDMILDEDKHTNKIDFIQDNDRKFYSFHNNSTGDKLYLPDAPLFSVGKNYQNPHSWKLDKIVTHNCPIQKIPTSLKFTKTGREIYCAKFGFSNPETNGSGTWTESNDVRIILKLDLSKKEPGSMVNFRINFKPFINPKQKQLNLTWTINDQHIKSQLVNHPKQLTTHLQVPVKLLKLRDLIEFKIELSQLTSPKEMRINTDSRKLGLFIQSIEIE